MHTDATTIEDQTEEPIALPRKSSVAPSQRLSVTSNSELDNVNLDDEAPTEPKGPWFG